MIVLAPSRKILRLSLVVALAAASAPATATAHGDPGAAGLHSTWLSAWSASPLELAPLGLLAFLYGRRAARLGRRLPPWRIACFAAGLAVLGLAVTSPIDAVGEDGLFAVHMLQHTLLGAIAPLLLLLGLTGPVLRPLLRWRSVRRAEALMHPAVALPVWVGSFVAWHLPPLYEAALASPVLHAVEHAWIVGAGLLLWAPVVEPLPGPSWFTTRLKCGYVAAVWFCGLLAANVFWFSGTVFYGRYSQTAPTFGVSALHDQADAGTVMMLTHCLLALGVVTVLFFRQSSEEQLRQRLLEAGLERGRVDRAVRAGRAVALARRHGVPDRIRPGID